MLSPGLIHVYKHSPCANNRPYVAPGQATDERCEHRRDRRRGLNGAPLAVTGGASTVEIAAHELRHGDTAGYALADGALECAGASYISIPRGTTNTTRSLPAGDGTKTVAVCYRDRAGNTGSAVSTIVLDEHPPTPGRN